jgi:tetratricopeptide (TPR) repeat protein
MINEDRMGSEHNMAGRLPEPPAPSPEAREAAIARALQQFDQANEDAAQQSEPRLLTAASAPRGRMTLGRPSVRYLVAASVAAFIAVPVGWLYLKDLQRVETTASKQQPEKTTPELPTAESSRSLNDRIGAAAPPAASPPPPAPAPSVATAPDAATAPPARPAAPAPRAAPRSEQPPAQDIPAERRARKKASGAVATSEGDLGACSTGDPAGTITGCTRIIEDRARGLADRRQAFLERGMAYAQRGEFDRAIGDFTETIKLDPGNAAAFYNRSLAYRAKGEHDRARADCSQATGIDAGYRSRC